MGKMKNAVRPESIIAHSNSLAKSRNLNLYVNDTVFQEVYHLYFTLYLLNWKIICQKRWQDTKFLQ